MKRLTVLFFTLALSVSTSLGYLLPCAGAAEKCEKWVAKVVSVQGTIQARKAGETSWVVVALNDTLCPGDMLRVQERSRAAIVLSNEATLRLDQNTTITFTGLEEEQTFLLKLFIGAVHFFSRMPRSLKVATPFINGTVEGTEFYVRVGTEETLLTIFEGRVLAANAAGSLVLERGQSAAARREQAPTPRIVVQPRDAVHWALYYPPVIEYRPGDFLGETENGWQERVRRSIELYWSGDLAGAFSSLQGISEDIRDPRFFTYRAGLLLTVGRVEEARVDIERALDLDPTSSEAFALQAIVAVAQNHRDKALELAGKAVELNPESSVAKVALSYAQQASFDLQGALDSLQEAVTLDPENALAWARLSELWQSFGYLGRSLETAQKAVGLNPHLERTQTVLGFAHLTQIKIDDSKEAFENAIKLDQAAPLPRLGLGLAKIRGGDLKEGTGEIEIAATLDPNNSLIRSYLGKAYYEEKRTELDGPQYAIAKELDPHDPTPWFYDAIRKQTINRPVEALHDLQRSIELNNNRAVFRSSLLLDEDLAARSASLGRIYSDLGFQQMGLVEGWRSVNTDPANHSAHRLLADLYAALPRHEIARVSELLQSQLLQPINITPIQPRLAQSDLLILDGAGPSDPSSNEFNPLFLRNRLALQASGIVGENDTNGGEVIQSGVSGGASYSVGYLRFLTDGFRENNDVEQDVINLFFQGTISYQTSFQAELRRTETETGDLPLMFDPSNFSSTLRREDLDTSARLGFHHAFSPHSDIIASLIYQDSTAEARDARTQTTVSLPAPLPPIPVPADIDADIRVDEEGFLAELQHLWRSERFRLTSGGGYYYADREIETTTTTVLTLPFPPFFITVPGGESDDSTIRHANLYAYSLINYPETVTWTLGASANFLEGAIEDRDQFNPKFGFTWHPFSSTTLRGAVFRTLNRTLISSQTLEPTQVAGFNQFFDDTEAVDAWRYGIGVDQKFSQVLHGGVEVSRRDLDKVPALDRNLQVKEFDWEEDLARAYLYWAPHKWFAASAEYQYERFDRDPEFSGEQLIDTLKTHRVPLAINFFHPWGFGVGLKASYIDQDGTFVIDQSSGSTLDDSDNFWVLDAALSYRLPKRYGLITVEARNLLDEEFKFQDTDPANPLISPERFVFVRFTLSF